MDDWVAQGFNGGAQVGVAGGQEHEFVDAHTVGGVLLTWRDMDDFIGAEGR